MFIFILVYSGSFSCMYACAPLHMQCWQGPEEGSRFPRAGVHRRVWVLKTDLRFSVRTIRALNYWAMFLVSKLHNAFIGAQSLKTSTVCAMFLASEVLSHLSKIPLFCFKLLINDLYLFFVFQYYYEFIDFNSLLWDHFGFALSKMYFCANSFISTVMSIIYFLLSFVILYRLLKTNLKIIVMSF